MTAAELVREVEVAGGRLIPLDDGGLRVAAPEPLPDDLVNRLRQHKPEVIAILTRADLQASGWDAETAALIEWFLTTSPPRAPFTLSKAVVVAHPARWWEALRCDLAAGPNGPRARYGALQQDLRRLAALMKRE